MSAKCCVPGRDKSSSSTPIGGDSEVASTSSGSEPRSLVTVAGGRFQMGDDSSWAYQGDGEAPVHEVTLPEFRIDRYAVTNRQFGEIRKRQRLDDGRREILVVVRLFWPPPRRVPAYPGSRKCTVVAPGYGCRLAPSRRAPVDHRRSPGSSRCSRLMERCLRLLRFVRDEIAHRGRVGVCGPWRSGRPTVPLGRATRTRRCPPDECFPGRLPHN